MTEAEWQKQVLKSAHQLGWQSMHIGRTGKHQAVGAKGTMGTGWPDLFLCRPGRSVFVECKVGTEQPSLEQKRVMALLMDAGHEVFVWRPQDFAWVLDVLAGGA